MEERGGREAQARNILRVRKGNGGGRGAGAVAGCAVLSARYWRRHSARTTSGRPLRAEQRLGGGLGGE